MTHPLQNQFDQILRTPGVAPNPFEKILAARGIVREDVRRAALGLQSVDYRDQKHQEALERNAELAKHFREQDGVSSVTISPTGGISVIGKKAGRVIGQTSQPRQRQQQGQGQGASTPATLPPSVMPGGMSYSQFIKNQINGVTTTPAAPPTGPVAPSPQSTPAGAPAAGTPPTVAQTAQAAGIAAPTVADTAHAAGVQGVQDLRDRISALSDQIQSDIAESDRRNKSPNSGPAGS